MLIVICENDPRFIKNTWPKNYKSYHEIDNNQESDHITGITKKYLADNHGKPNSVVKFLYVEDFDCLIIKSRGLWLHSELATNNGLKSCDIQGAGNIELIDGQLQITSFKSIHFQIETAEHLRDKITEGLKNVFLNLRGYTS